MLRRERSFVDIFERVLFEGVIAVPPSGGVGPLAYDSRSGEAWLKVSVDEGCDERAGNWELTMTHREQHDAAPAPATKSGPLSDLVDEELNKSLADQIAEELDEQREEPARSGTDDYAHGTTEHEDEPEAE